VTEFHYLPSVVLGGAAVLLPLSMVGVGLLLVGVQGHDAFASVVRELPAPEVGLVFDLTGLGVALAVGVTAVVHD
jgi:hypothetical protein